MGSQSHLSSCSAYQCVQLTGVFIRPPTACFLFINEFSISSRRPTFSSWMDTKASISLQWQTRLCLLKSQHKSTINHQQCNLFFSRKNYLLVLFESEELDLSPRLRVSLSGLESNPVVICSSKWFFSSPWEWETKWNNHTAILDLQFIHVVIHTSSAQ